MRGSKKPFPIGGDIGLSCTPWNKSLFDPNFFDRAIRSAHPVKDPRIPSQNVTGCADRTARSEKFLKPTADLTTPQTTRSHHTDGSLQQLRCWLDCCCYSFSPPANSAYRHPMAAVRAIDDFFANAAAAVLALAPLDYVQRRNRDDGSYEDAPRAR